MERYSAFTRVIAAPVALATGVLMAHEGFLKMTMDDDDCTEALADRVLDPMEENWTSGHMEEICGSRWERQGLVDCTDYISGGGLATYAQKNCVLTEAGVDFANKIRREAGLTEL